MINYFVKGQPVRVHLNSGWSKHFPHSGWIIDTDWGNYFYWVAFPFDPTFQDDWRFKPSKFPGAELWKKQFSPILLHESYLIAEEGYTL